MKVLKGYVPKPRVCRWDLGHQSDAGLTRWHFRRWGAPVPSAPPEFDWVKPARWAMNPRRVFVNLDVTACRDGITHALARSVRLDHCLRTLEVKHAHAPSAIRSTDHQVQQIQHNMQTPDFTSSSVCYFSLPISSSHFSTETPSATPLAAYSPNTDSDPYHPLLASRPLSPESHMSTTETSSLLQLQTSAAHRPNAQPLQPASTSPSSTSASSSSSGSGLTSPSTLCCSRCRRESSGSMVQFGTNLFYCNHCAKMTGYCAG